MKRKVHLAFVEEMPDRSPIATGTPFYAVCHETLIDSCIGAWTCTNERGVEGAIDVAVRRLDRFCNAEHVL